MYPTGGAAPVSVSQIRSDGSCAASFIPLWAGLPVEEQIDADYLFTKFEESGSSPHKPQMLQQP